MNKIIFLLCCLFLHAIASDFDRLDYSFSKLQKIIPQDKNEVKRLKKSYSSYTDYYAKIDKNGNESLLRLGKLYSDGIQESCAGDIFIKPLKNKEFYIVINHTGFEHFSFINLESKYHKVNEENFLGLKDIDNDNIPEIIGHSYNTIKVYKIININKNPTVKLLFKHKEPPTSHYDYYNGLMFNTYLGYVVYYTFDYYKEDGFIIPKRHEKKCSKKECIKIFKSNIYKYKNYTNLKIKNNHHYHGTSFEPLKRILKHYNLSERDKMKLLLSPKAYRLKCMKTYDKVYFKDIKKDIKIDPVLCKRGKGVTKTNNGLLVFKDFDLQALKYLDIHKSKDYTFVYDKKYLIVSDNHSKKTKYFLWKDLLGFEPLNVKYFDAKRLIVETKDFDFIYYKVEQKLSDIKKEQW